MYALIRGRWADQWLDESLEPRDLRIQVEEWNVLAPLEGAYFVRSASFHFLIGQLRRLGPVDMVRKIRSRRAERGRNERWLVTGSGLVVACGSATSAFPLGSRVRFVAPRHPAGMERVVLHEDLCRPADGGAASGVTQGEALRVSASPPNTDTRADVVEGLAGWHPASGVPIPPGLVDTCLDLPQGAPAQRHAGRSAVTMRRGGQVRGPRQRPRLLVVGYGNYAKTVAMPQLSRFLDLVGVCDLDPFQVPPADTSITWATSHDHFDPQEFDVALVAGYHHTHVPVAEWALAHGKDVIIEKPVFTTTDQAAHLERALSRSRGRLFVGFQRRHSPFNSLLDRDLPADGPRDYHCVVFEEQLPEHHWYRWPNSGGRLVANGCHWIDHFLFINKGSPVLATHVQDLGFDRMSVSLRLANQAVMTMTLTSAGSPRLGMRDYIEIRSAGVTVRIADSARYEAESSDRLIRKQRVAPLAAHHAMYHDFGARIAAGAPGDSIGLALQSGLTTVACAEQYAAAADAS